MIVYSQQIKIIKSVFYSFKNHKITNLSTTNSELQKYQSIYKYQKFETLTENNFKILIIYLIFKKRFSSLRSVLTYLSETDLKEHKQIINNFSDLLIGYESNFEKEEKKVSVFDKKINIVISLYKKNEISFIYLYYFMYKIYKNQNQIQGRIQQRLWNDLKILLCYFKKIKLYLEQKD